MSALWWCHFRQPGSLRPPFFLLRVYHSRRKNIPRRWDYLTLNILFHKVPLLLVPYVVLVGQLLLILKFHCAIGSNCLFLHCTTWFSTVDGRWGRTARSLVNRATADPVWRFVQLYISWKMLTQCWSAAGFCKLPTALYLSLWEKNGNIIPARTCQDRRKIFVPALAGRDMQEISYINRSLCCHSDLGLWLWFVPLAFGYVKKLYNEAVDYNSASQGRNTTWCIGTHELLQYMHTNMHTVCIRTNAHRHEYIHSYIHAYVHTCMHSFMHAYIHTYIHTYIKYIHITIYFHNSVCSLIPVTYNVIVSCSAPVLLLWWVGFPHH